MAINGLMAHAKPYPLTIDTRVDSSAQAMIDDIARGDIDCGILWGPMAGYFASRSNPALIVAPLLKETTGSAPDLSNRNGGAPVGPGIQAHAQQVDR